MCGVYEFFFFLLDRFVYVFSAPENVLLSFDSEQL